MLPTDLYCQLMKELGLTWEQAEGSVGALLKLAQTRLPPEDFDKVADTIPAVSDVISKSPRFEAPPRSRFGTLLNRMFGGLGDLSPLVKPLGSLRIDKATIPRIASILSRSLEGHGHSGTRDILNRVL